MFSSTIVREVHRQFPRQHAGYFRQNYEGLTHAGRSDRVEQNDQGRFVDVASQATASS